MSATSSKTPPRLLQSLVAHLLPRERHEQVLGDLEERFRAAPPSRALLMYVFEVVTVVPAILYSHMRSGSSRRGVPQPLQLGSGITTVRTQVEDFQYENRCRLRFYSSMSALGCAFLAWKMFTTDLWLPRLVGGVFIAIFLFTVHQHHRRGSARSVPEGNSLSELVAFHRRELARRRDFLRTLWYWKMAPLGIPILVALIFKRNASAASSALVTFSSFALANIAARRQAQGIQKRIDELDAHVLDGDASS